jgi:acetoin utilization protein AcuC
VHEADRWPYSGRLEDRSTGNARNLPVPRGFNDSEMDFVMSEAVLPLATGFRPDGVVVTCGADGLLGDPLSAMALSNGCLWDAVIDLCGLCESVVVLGGGGYNPWTVARCWTGLWGRICGYKIPDTLPVESVRLLESLECDLVEEEDRLDYWMTTLADPPNAGPIREEIKEVAAMISEAA